MYKDSSKSVTWEIWFPCKCKRPYKRKKMIVMKIMSFIISKPPADWQLADLFLQVYLVIRSNIYRKFRRKAHILEVQVASWWAPEKPTNSLKDWSPEAFPTLPDNIGKVMDKLLIFSQLGFWRQDKIKGTFSNRPEEFAVL